MKIATSGRVPMKEDYMFMKIRLNLFDGESEGAPQGEVKTPGTTRRGKGEFSNVKFGKQPEGEITNATNPPAAGETKSEVITTSDALEEKRKAFQDLVKGEYKDQYTEATQRLINRRFAETKTLEDQIAAMQPLVSTLAERYGIDSSDLAGISKAIDGDASFLAEMAEQAGMTVEQYKQFTRMKRENDAFRRMQQQTQNQQLANMQVQKWVAEAEAFKAKVPDFSLEAEAQNPQFVNMLKAGIPVEHAYKVAHFDELMTDAMQTTAAQTEAAVVNNVRARGTRPQENMASSQGAAIVKDDVSKLTKEERAEVVKRAARGERIEF